MAAAERWATFDCYGTLIDWNAGIGAQLARLFGEQAAPRLLARYHELEPRIQAEAYGSYREVLERTLARLAADDGVALPAHERSALAESLPGWPPFAEVPGALRELRRRGWRLAVLSNSDRDLIAASQARLGIEFDAVVVAEDVRSYKPAHAHWRQFFAQTRADAERHLHVAASVFHDIAPAGELGLRSVWINRLAERSEVEPTRELSDLAALPDVADELVAA